MLAYTDFEEIKSLRGVGKMFLVGFVFQFIVPAIVIFAILQGLGVI